MSRSTAATLGVVLAAGAGKRLGQPKALVRDARGVSWLARVCSTLTSAGLSRVAVVLGAGAKQAAQLVPPGVFTVVCEAWEEGLSASVRCALRHALNTGAEAVLITLVDLPDLRPEAVTRVLAASDAGLARATYQGRPGHPVLIERAHWSPLLDQLRGDRGAGRYLATHGAVEVECGDLGGGDDVDAHPGAVGGLAPE